MALSRADRRRLDKHQPSVDRVTEADAKFFERFPDRRHRVRLAAPAEVAQNAIMAPEEDLTPLLGTRWVVLVKQLQPGVRLRAFAQATGADDFDLDEDDARDLYDAKVRLGSRLHVIEAQMRAALATMGKHP